MAYDAFGRLRGKGDPGYFESRDAFPDYEYNTAYSNRDNNPPSRRRDDRPRASPLNHDRMTSSTDRFEGSVNDGVSPEVLATLTEQITERVKKELVEHLKQTGNIDGQTRAEPMQRDTSGRSSSSSSPPPPPRRVYTPPSPIKPTRTAYAPPPPMDSKRSPAASPLERPSGVRFSDREPRTRPAGGRTYSTIELSTIDQKWGRLFDNQGTPTQRLGEFLRGLANHIVDDFSPKKSIVVTPAKLATYYSSYSVGLDEPHPFLTIFRAQANEQISQLYRDMGCQHHLVQDNTRNEPTIPALTPLGFAHFMTVIILAYPEVEWKRLEKVVMDLPIDADGLMVDGKPERLPKQISRHLLPEREDPDSKQVLDNAVSDFYENLGTSKKSKPSITSPPLSRHSSTTQARRSPVDTNQPNTKSQPIERERKPYGGTPSASAIKEEAVKIERDRQPYSAQPGNGKVHHDDSNLGTNSRPGRANSTSRTREVPGAGAGDSRHHRTQSTTIPNYMPPPREQPPLWNDRRNNNSPPLRSFRNSEPTFGVPPPPSTTFGQTFNQPSYTTGPSTTFPPPPPPIDIHRRSRDERDYPIRGSPDDTRFATSEFNSPRDAERYDRYQDSRSSDASDHYDIPYERGSVTIDPNERGAPAEEWYRENSRGAGPGYYGTRGAGGY